MKKLLVLAAIASVAAASARAAVTADLKLESQGDKAVAQVVVKQSGTEWVDGKVTVEWTAPDGKFCEGSTIELAFKASDRYRTRASRTWVIPIKGTDCVAVCDGAWKVKVSYEGAELASGEIVVKKVEMKAAEPVPAPAKK